MSTHRPIIIAGQTDLVLSITAGFAPTPFGRCLVAQCPEGICRLSFPEPENEEAEWTALRQAWPMARLRRDDAAAARMAAAIFTETGRSLPILVQGTPFQLMVWQTLPDIPYGTTLSYGQLASTMGRPTATRAVANAVAKNPVAFLIPCHRVLSASGTIGGYRWGQVRKGAILAWERQRLNQGKRSQCTASCGDRAGSRTGVRVADPLTATCSTLRPLVPGWYSLLGLTL